MTGTDEARGQGEGVGSEAYFRRLVDLDALEAYLTEHLGPASEYEVTRHQAGHSNETLFVTWDDARYVLRRPPPGETAETAHDVLREYRVMSALQDTNVRVPTTVVSCDDHSVIGADFYLMMHEQGDVLRDDEPERFATPEHRCRVGEELVDELARIHSVEYDAVGLGEFGYPDGYTERQVDRWHKQFAWAFEVTSHEREVPTVETVGAWLDEHIPDSYPHTLVHGDYKLDNVMFAPGTPPRLKAVFDWELSTLGDPRFDLGWMLTYWWDPKDPPAPRPEDATFMQREGYSTRLDLVDRYEDATGIRFEHDRFYRALSVYKIAALGEMFYRRHLEGNADNPMYPLMREYVPKFLDRAERIIDGDEPL